MWLEQFLEPPGVVSILSGVFGDLIKRYLVHTELVAALTDQVADRDHLVPEQPGYELVQAIGHAGWISHEAGDHRVEERPGHRQTGFAQHNQIILQILPHFARLRGRQQWSQVFDARVRLVARFRTLIAPGCNTHAQPPRRTTSPTKSASIALTLVVSVSRAN